MFEDWRQHDKYRTLYPVDRSVMVNTNKAFPAGKAKRADELPLWLKSGGLSLEPWMPGRQVAWVRRSTGEWLAVVVMEAGSANGQSRVTMQLWLVPSAITTDLGVGQ